MSKTTRFFLFFLFPFFLFVGILAACRSQTYPTQTFSEPMPPISHPFPGDEQMSECFKLTAADVTPILAEPVSLTWTLDYNWFGCVFVSEAESLATLDPNEHLLPTYGPFEQHNYVSINILSNYTPDDTLDKLVDALAEKDFDPRRILEKKFDSSYLWSSEVLAELATLPMQRDNLKLQYLPDVSKGALWYWQSTHTGHHLAGIYVPTLRREIAIHAFVSPQRSEADTQHQMIGLVDRLHKLAGDTAQP